MRQKTKLILLFLFPIVSLTILFQIYPFILNILYSFLDWNGMTALASWNGWNNYREILKDGLFWNAISNSILYAVIATLCQVFVSFFLAYFVEFGLSKHKVFYRVFFIMPIVATTATIGMIIRSMFSYNGIVNQFLALFDIAAIPWLTDPIWAFILVILVSVWKETGALFIYWLAGFQLVSKDVLEAAKIDGVTQMSLITKIVLPIMKPIILMVSALTFINSLKTFDLIQTLTAGGPYFGTDVVSTFIYRTAFSSSFGSPQLSYASAAAIVWVCLLGFVVVLFKVGEKYIRRWSR